MVADEYGGLRQHEFAKGVQVTVQLALVPPRQVGHVGDQRHVGVIRGDLSDGADVLRAADKTHLDGGYRHVFERGARLLGNSIFVKCKVVQDFCCVAGIGAGHHRQRVCTGR